MYGTIKRLLENVNSIIANEKENAQKTGSRFNIFNIIGISTREVYMCRFLAELLDSQGCHSQGTKYLDLFINILAEKSNSYSSGLKKIKIENVIIRKEDLTKYVENHENRRIDIVIDEKDGYYIPIEVKINADEQNYQCSDYLEQVKNCYKRRRNKTDNDVFMFFLTKNGYEPQNIKQDDKEKIICLSWKEDITKWLEKCIKKTSKQAISIRELLKQFKVSIEQFSNNVGDNTMLEIKELLKDKDNFESAIKIKECVEQYSEDLWKELVSKILTGIEKNGINIDLKNIDWTIKFYSDESNGIYYEAAHNANIRNGYFKKGKIENGQNKDFPENYQLAEYIDDQKVNEILNEINEWNKYTNAN